MHLGNGALTPECAVATAAVAAVGLAYATVTLRRTNVGRKGVAAAGVLGAAVFALQMFNVPVLAYSSGHVVGGVLLAVLLGPAHGALTMAAILTLQALLLGDGGLAALGANIINMALVPAVVWHGGRRWVSYSSPVKAGLLAAASVLLAAVLIVMEVALGRTAASTLPLAGFAREMFLVHVVIALGEGVVTAAIVAAWERQAEHDAPRKRRWGMYTALVAGATLIALALPLASPLPDGYEAAAERSAWTSLLAEDAAALSAVGALNARLASWQESFAGQVAAWLPAEQLQALVLIAVAGLASCLMAVGLTPRGRTLPR